MRYGNIAVVTFGLVAASSGIAAGCTSRGGNCELNLNCATGGGSTGTGGSTSTSTTSTAGSTSTGTGGTGGDAGGPKCQGDPTADASVVNDACAVFVDASAAGSAEDGTQANPYKTLQKAIDNAADKWVLVCTGGKLSEAVTISARTEVYGGYSCDKWVWASDARSTLEGPADKVALTLTSGAEGSKVWGFSISAANATVKGGSSVAVAVDDIQAELRFCDIKAGNGLDGDDGMTPAGLPTDGTSAPAPDPLTMNACINQNSLMTGPPGMTTCDDGVSVGGTGGKGGITGTDNGNGQSGTEGQPANGTDGLGGQGQTDPTDPALQCAVGTKGKDGDNGAAGPGGLSLGALSLAGVVDMDMTDGKPGSRGQGGGGGGGAKSGQFCAGSVDGNGASGGGGGGGGCGGKGGGGGKAGGSSIAIVSLGTQLNLNEVTLTLGKGGAGGKGAIGQSGGGFGFGAGGGAKGPLAGSKAGCKGGDGGAGGDGGPGGGGRGGHAIGIAYAKAPASMPVIKNFTAGTPGGGGTAGAGAPPISDGADGKAGQCLDFTTGMPCP